MGVDDGGAFWSACVDGVPGILLHVVQEGCGEQHADEELLGEDLEGEYEGEARGVGQEGAESCQEELQGSQEQVALEGHLVAGKVLVLTWPFRGLKQLQIAGKEICTESCFPKSNKM
jgi:hypothetical protein